MAVIKAINPGIVSKKTPVIKKKPYIKPQTFVRKKTKEDYERELPMVFEKFGEFMSNLSDAIKYMVRK